MKYQLGINFCNTYINYAYKLYITCWIQHSNAGNVIQRNYLCSKHINIFCDNSCPKVGVLNIPMSFMKRKICYICFINGIQAAVRTENNYKLLHGFETRYRILESRAALEARFQACVNHNHNYSKIITKLNLFPYSPLLQFPAPVALRDCTVALRHDPHTGACYSFKCLTRIFPRRSRGTH